jgi:hypothetical protein
MIKLLRNNMFGKKKQENLMVKDLLNDIERAECIKTRIMQQLKKDIDRPIQINNFGPGFSGTSGFSGSSGVSGSAGWGSSFMPSSFPQNFRR